MNLSSDLFSTTPDTVTTGESNDIFGSTPAYIRSADNHNLGNVGSSWFDVNPLNLPKFAAVSIVSGLNSIYNTGVKIGNLFGADAEESKTEDVINSVFSGLDSDLGQYYQQNKQAADLAGFLVTSLVPGIGGVKILNAGQKALAAASDGFVGTNLGMALGLRTPQIETYIAAAGKEIATGQAAFTSITSGTVKALSAGVYQNVLEGAAFETAVQATMQASPILQDQDKKDILWNIATAGVFGGIVGGAFESAKTFGLIKKEAQRVSGEINPYGSRGTTTFANTSVPSDKIISLADDLEHGPTLDPNDPLYQEQVKKLTARQQRIGLDIRQGIMEMVPGSDNDIGRMVADFQEGQSGTDTMSVFLDSDQIGRLKTKTTVETAQADAAKNGTPDPALQVSYAKLTGEGAGLVSNEAPAVPNLADLVVPTAGNSSKDQILSDIRSEKFSVDDRWDASKVNLGDSGHLQAEKRQIWASTVMAPIKDEQAVGAMDLPVLERALADGQYSIRVVDSKGTVLHDGFANGKALQDYIISAKDEAAYALQRRAMRSPNSEMNAANTSEEFNTAQDATTTKIGKITNTTVGRLEATNMGDPSRDYFAWQQLQKQRDDFLRSKNLNPVGQEEQDPRFLPTYAKITRVIRDKEVDGNVLDGMTYIRTMQNLAQEGVENVIAKQAPEIYDQLPDISDSHLARASVLGTGAGKFTFNNPGYDSLGSTVSLIGSKLADYARTVKDLFSKQSEGTLAQLAKNQDAVIEWSSLNQRVSRSAKQWVKYQDENGTHYLVEANDFKKIFGKDGSGDLGDVSEDDNLITINNQEVGNLADAHANQQRDMFQRRNERASALGADQARNLEVEGYPLFRPIPPDPKDYPFFAFVSDPTVTSQGHMSMIFAKTDAQLREKVEAAQRARPELDIHYKQDTVDFQKARQAYDYDRTLSDNYIDSSLKNNGIYSDYFAKTDPQAVVNDYLQYHTRLLDTDARELVRTKYSNQFDWLEDQAKAYSRIETSKFGGNFEALEAQGKNPYLSYIKTALNLSKMQESPLWYNINKYADNAVSALVGKVQSIWGANQTLDDSAIKSINDSLQKYGMNTGYYDAATNLVVNQQVPTAQLSKFIRGANAVLSKLTLGLDPLNALVNTLGANILRSTELKQLTDAVSEGDSDIAGKLADLSKIDITGKGDLILSPAKLMATAMKDFFDKDSPNHALYQSLGLQKDIGTQFRSILDDLALRGTETASDLNSRFQSAVAKLSDLSSRGQQVTGNKIAEEFNRFVSARSIQLLTDPAVERGILTQQEQYAYMNTFVNRVEGNIVASQRPLAFQGPIGQAVGLFQSYQFNLMQQMFRYVSEGSTKDAAMLLGLQGTFFGIQGLPAFQAINQHIIGTASGNPKHIDAYDAMYGIAGKNLGDILTYGLPSKLLSTNLYSRGDINPRQLTVLPTALQDIPIVGAFTKLFDGIKTTAERIASGGNVWESILQGIEHNGISRPLSGIAQTLQATVGNGTPFSTTSKGSIMFSNDLLSMATLSRLAGGRPLDEAIINDGIFRIHSYQQDDLAKMNTLSEAIKTASINGQIPDSDQWSTFADRYQRNGGKQVQFNKFMVREIKAADTSGVDKITSQLNSPFAQKAQLLMGDGTSTVSNF